VTAEFIGMGHFGGLEYHGERMCRQSIPNSGMQAECALRAFFLSACRQTKKPGAIGRVSKNDSLGTVDQADSTLRR
jgi:hypothetical protein